MRNFSRVKRKDEKNLTQSPVIAHLDLCRNINRKNQWGKCHFVLVAFPLHPYKGGVRAVCDTPHPGDGIGRRLAGYLAWDRPKRNGYANWRFLRCRRKSRLGRACVPS